MVKIVILFFLIMIFQADNAFCAIFEPSPKVVNESEYPIKINLPKELNLKDKEVTDIFHFDMYNSFVDPKVWQNAQAPQIQFSQKSKEKWKRLNFPGVPFIISSLNAPYLLNIPEECKSIVFELFNYVQNYSYSFTSGDLSGSDNNWLQIQRLIKPKPENHCSNIVRKSYIVASASIFDPSASLNVTNYIHTKNGFRIARNMPLILLTAYLFNHNKLFLFSKEHVGNKSTSIPHSKSDLTNKIYGGYQCENHEIYLYDQLPPFNLAGSLHHELSHAFRDSFIDSSIFDSLSSIQFLSMDETISVISGAQAQLDLADHYVSSQIQKLRRGFSGVKINSQNDFNLYDTQGKLSELFHFFYKEPENRSQLPGTPSWLFPKLRPMALTYLDILLEKVFFRFTNSDSIEYSKASELSNNLLLKMNTISTDLVRLVKSKYFPNDDSSDSQVDPSMLKLTSKFDPYSLWLAKASNFLIIEGNLVKTLKTRDHIENQKYERYEGVIVKNNSGNQYNAFEVLELIQLPESNDQRVEIKISDSDDLFTITYDLESLLNWLTHNSQAFNTISKTCERLSTNDAKVPDSYVGKHIYFNIPFENESEINSEDDFSTIKPGGMGIKPGSSIIKPGGMGIKPELFNIRPNMHVDGL